MQASVQQMKEISNQLNQQSGQGSSGSSASQGSSSSQGSSANPGSSSDQGSSSNQGDSASSANQTSSTTSQDSANQGSSANQGDSSTQGSSANQASSSSMDQGNSDALIDKKTKIIGDMMKAKMAAKNQIFSILNDKQRTELQSKMKKAEDKMIEKFKECHED